MVHLRLERALPVAPEVAWPFIAEPDLISRWSRAAVELVALGDGAHPGGVGAVRSVRLHGRPALVLEEVIEESAAPRRLVYRVFRGAPVTDHVGQIELEPTEGGCRLVWTVTLAGALPGVETLALRLLRPALEASLAALAAQLADRATASRPSRPPPPVRDLDEAHALPALRAEAMRCAKAQREMADRLLGRGDDRGWFARIYQGVSEVLIADADSGRLRHPAWALRLIPPFHRLYVDNLRRRLGEIDGEVEAHWRRAFLATERLRPRGRAIFDTMALAIFLGMRAHIEHDLPRALAEVYLSSYVGRCDYARFRADYLRMAEAISAAGDRLLADLPRHTWPLVARIYDRLTPRALRPTMLDRKIYPLRARRREAFERGAALVVMSERLARLGANEGDLGA
jgi:hypothetical protein